MKTYQITENENESFVVETDNISTSKTYQKEWIVEDIARLQLLLNQFPK